MFIWIYRRHFYDFSINTCIDHINTKAFAICYIRILKIIVILMHRIGALLLTFELLFFFLLFFVIPSRISIVFFYSLMSSAVSHQLVNSIHDSQPFVCIGVLTNSIIIIPSFVSIIITIRLILVKFICVYVSANRYYSNLSIPDIRVPVTHFACY